jgi:SAM-dependent methyltransferase
MKDVPSDYYARLHAVEERHWWHAGMREITKMLLRDRLDAGHLSLLDAGCGTGGFLLWASRTGSFDRLCGVDVSAEAIDLARGTVPAAELHVAPLDAIPFPDESFDVVTLNDVLQHVDEHSLVDALNEVRRVLRESGTLLVRTNGARDGRRERSDWRLYDERSLRAELERGGFRVERVTHANSVLSAWGAVRGRTPRAPTGTSCGIPSVPGKLANGVGWQLLRLEARYLGPRGRRLPYGHTLLALATPR